MNETRRQPSSFEADLPVGKSLRIRLLGGIAIDSARESRAHRLWQKSQALLAFLAAQAGTSYTREKLASLFWPDLQSDVARNNLRQTLLNLQRGLGDKSGERPCLRADRQSIAFEPDSNALVDVIELQEALPKCPSNRTSADCDLCLSHLEYLAGLYTGEFAAGLYLDDCPDFDAWLHGWRETLHLKVLTLLEQVAQCHENAGNSVSALAAAQRYTELEPWSEEGHRRLMRLLAANGQVAAALNQYDRCQRLLADELGITPGEKTRELAQAISSGEFLQECVRETSSADAGRGVVDAGEHRHVTVLYCSFGLVDMDDSEEAIGLLQGPQATCLSMINAFSGHAVMTSDGGLLAYFGYPEVSERAALQAVRAALALAGESFVGLELRIGMHAGLVITSRDPARPDAVGKTTGTAMRLSMLAEPGTVCISPALHCLVAGYVTLEDRGPVQFPDRAKESLQVLRLLGLSGASHRLEAAESLSPLVGREQEIALLEECWAKVCGGAQQTLLVHGDPGIGKSRLLYHLKVTLLSQAEVAVRELHCLPELSQTPFAPLKEFFEVLFGVSSADSAEAKFRALVRYVQAQYPRHEHEVVPLLTSMLALPLAEPYQPSAMSPRAQRERIMVLIIDRLRRLTEHQPMILIAEDLHWVDPTTLELLTRFCEGEWQARILLLLTARPEFTPPWDEILVRRVELEPLDDSQVRRLVEQPHYHLEPALLKKIVERADGVPLFAEELARTLAASVNQNGLASVPSTLQDLLGARLEALGEARYIARLAATIGREFELDILEKTSRLARKTIMDMLRIIQGAGLIEEIARGRFVFRHGLFQDAAYQSQPRAERRESHRSIAALLEAEFPDTVQERPEMLAQHWAAAEQPEHAIRYRLIAARNAGLHSSYHEALMHLRSGLVLVEKLRPGSVKAQLEFDLRIALAWAYVALEGFASKAAGEAFAQAISLSERVEGKADIFHALWGIWTSASSSKDNRRAMDMAQRLLDMARQSREPMQHQQAHFALGNTLYWQGRFSESHHHLTRAVHLYRPEQHSDNIASFGENGGVSSLSYLSWTLWDLGFADQARRMSDKALQLAEEVQHPFSMAYGLTFAMVLYRHLQEPQKTLELAEQVLELAERYDFPLWQAGVSLKRGWAQVMLGQEQGIVAMRESVDNMRAAMSGVILIFLETLVDALCFLGRYEEAESLIHEAFREGERLDDHHAEAELYRLLAQCQVNGGTRREDLAKASLDKAIAISRSQQARLPQLRATMALARLPHTQRDSSQAYLRLQEVYAGFSEGFDTPDLQQAAQLLDELQGES